MTIVEDEAWDLYQGIGWIASLTLFLLSCINYSN